MPYSKRAGDFRPIISVVHTPTGTTFSTDGNRVRVEADGFTDTINTYDHKAGRNGVRTEAQLRTVAADWLTNHYEEILR